ncbi:MAG: energy-coupling factor transporter transmembrane component T [Micrococcaceae bacterium]
MEMNTIRRDTFISVRNPLFKIITVLVLTVPIFFTLNVSVPAVLVVFYLLLLPWWGIPKKRFIWLILPILIGASLSAFSTLILGEAGGYTYFQFLWMHITDQSIHYSFIIFFRILAIGLPALVLLITTEATELGDALIQKLHLPERFVLGAMAGLRMTNLIQYDWENLRRANRVRGLETRWGIKSFFSQAFTLFVISLRRAQKLAISMQAKGFDVNVKRTWARKSIVNLQDYLMVVVSIVFVIVAFQIVGVTKL